MPASRLVTKAVSDVLDLAPRDGVVSLTRLVAAVSEQRGQPIHQLIDPELTIEVPGFIPDDYVPDTGECRSNLSGANALFETYFPVGALDATRGLAKAPDAIIDTRSAPPNVPLRYVYSLPTRGVAGPYRVEARLLFRAFPPFLVRAFIDYERRQAARGKRPSGPMVDDGMFARLDIVEIERVEATIP